MSPERLAAYVILAPAALWLVAAACVALLRTACWLWETFAGVAAEAFPPDPPKAATLDYRTAIEGLCDHITKGKQ